jgi:CPA1 family monovalent cation:H+ antiporter
MALDLHAVQTVLLLLLVVVAAFAVLAERVKVPYPIVLLLAGLGLSFVPHVPRIPLNPQIVFLVLLPPLLYRAAWMTSWREFRFNLVSITMLAVGLVGFTVVGVALFADHFVTTLDWKTGLVLGAVVATTDAIAATSIANQLGLPKAITDILEGESLVNDATGLLAVEFGIAIVVQGQTPTVGMAVGKLMWLVAGGLGVGLVVGVLVTWVEKHVDDGPVEIVISVVAAYTAYLLGERVEASGVLSVVACGLYVSRKGGRLFSPQVRIQSMGVWEAIDFALNGIVFCLIGLQLPYVLAGIKGYSWGELVKYGLAFSAVLVVLRMLWMYPGAWVAWNIRTRLLGQRYKRPSAKGVFVLGWTGMRGVLSLAAALSIPETLSDGRPFPGRDLIVFLTYVVILVTLVGQGLTLPWLIRSLGLAGTDTSRRTEEIEARRAVLHAAIGWLETERATANDSERHVYDDLLHQYEHRLEAETGEMDSEGRERFGEMLKVMRGAARQERLTLMRLRDEGRVGDGVLRDVERELDLVESRIDAVK